MAKTPKELILMTDETIVSQITGNAYTDSPNPLIKLLSAIFRIFWIILGIKLTTYIIATNKRIVQIDKKTILWGIIPSDTLVRTLNKNTIQSVGYSYVVRWFFFRTSYFDIQNMTESIHVTYDGPRDELSKIVAELSELVAK